LDVDDVANIVDEERRRVSERAAQAVRSARWVL
jgi:hypothetical protein